MLTHKSLSYEHLNLNIMANTAQLYAYDFKSIKTYAFATIFIAGNLLLPQLFHAIPSGGPTFLPIYFFTLIAAYKYGIKVGLLTAVFSPFLNSLLFGMPLITFLPIIMIKSSLLAIAAGSVARYFGKVSLLGILITILAYQFVGSAIEWMMLGDFNLAMQDFKIGFPGMLIQLFGGYAVLKSLSKV